MHASPIALVLLCSQFGGQASASGEDSGLMSRSSIGMEAAAEVQVDVSSRRGDITYSMSYVVVEDPARFKIRLAASDDSMAYSMLVLPEPCR